MKTIRVIRGGCGICYKDANGTERHALKTAQDKPFECDDAQADRLVSLGVAEYVGRQVENLENATIEDDLEAMSYNELKKLAALKGVKPEGNKKADLITAIIEATEANEVIDEDELPDLIVADPE